MNGEISTTINEGMATETLRPMRSTRLVGIGFGIFCYVSLAAIYFFAPSNPVLSLGRARFTVDAVLELAFTLLALPFFGVAYFYGVRRHEENPDFAVPDFVIDLLFLAALVWVAIGNGIHLTAKLDEQMISAFTDERGLGIRANFHWIRQEVGHVFPHIGWQLLFASLMLGQLKRPYEGEKPKPAVSFFGAAFGLLFAHGAIAGGCTHIGFILTAISYLGFSHLGRNAKVQPGELPILSFFLSSQVTFLLAMLLYWLAFHRVLT